MRSDDVRLAEEPAHVRGSGKHAVHLRDDLDVRVVLISAISLALLMGSPAAAARDGGVPRAEGCAWHADASAFTLRGTLRFETLRGRFIEVADPRSGAFVRRWDVAGLPESNGSDGATAWVQDWSGTVHRLDAAHARRVAATDAWFDRRSWCAPGALGATSTRAVRRAQGGRTFDVVRTVPRGGVPVEIWFDAASGLPDRTIVRLNEVTRIVRFADWRDVGGTAVPFVRQFEYPEDGDVETLTTETIGSRHAARAAEFSPPATRNDVRMARGARSTTVPIRIERHKILVDVMLNGRGPFPFVLDTGGHFILTTATVRKLGLTVLAPGFVRVRELRIGDAIVRDNLAHRTSYSLARVERGPLPPKAGWLGIELFARFAAIIDPDARTLTLRPLREPAARYAGVRVPFTFDEDAPLVACRIDRVPGDCMIDTGNAGATIVEGHWAHAVGLSRRFARGLDAGGGVRLARAAVDIGAVHLPREIVAAYPPAARGSESTTVEAAILSETLHERYVTAIDYRQGAMWFAPARHRTPLPFSRTGLQLRRRTDGAFDVAFVFARSPAAAAGVRAGDRIVAIDGKPARAVTPDDLVALDTAPVGTTRTYRLVDGRSNVVRAVKIRSAELLP
jgi:hypothetical protein